MTAKPSYIPPEINYEESLKKHQLIYKMTGWRMIATFVYYLLFCGTLAILTELLFSDFYRDALFIKAICLLIAIWIIVNIFFNNLLVKISCNNSKPNKNDILETMYEFFPAYNFTVNNKQMMRSVAYVGRRYVMHTVITILFDNDSIYLNVATLGATNLPSFVHGILNYIKAKRIAKYFKSHYGA